MSLSVSNFKTIFMCHNSLCMFVVINVCLPTLFVEEDVKLLPQRSGVNALTGQLRNLHITCDYAAG